VRVRDLVRDIILRILALKEWKKSGVQFVYMPRIPSNVGGPKSFLSQLKNQLNRQGVKITHNKFAPFDVALVPITCDLKVARNWKRRGKKVVQRLDGLFYDHLSGDFDVEGNKTIPEIYREMADVVVFQSHYSRKQCQHFLGNSGAKVETIIYNGVDLELFKPCGIDLNPDSWRFVTTGNFRDESMVFPIIEALDKLHSAGIKFNWEVIGPIENDSWQKELKSRNYTRLAGPLSIVEISKKLQEAHLFLFSFLNPNCPNSVMEAVASGVPVVSFKSGSMNELCDFNKALLAEAGSNVIHTRDDLSSNAFFGKLTTAINGFEKFKANSIYHWDRWDIRTSAENYSKILSKQS